ncbi:MAG: hypothetical protein AAF658_00180 [Myxococcota bacterium]
MTTVDRPASLQALHQRAGELETFAMQVTAGAEPDVLDVTHLYDQISNLRVDYLTVLREQGNDVRYIGSILTGLEALARAAKAINRSSLRGVRAAMEGSFPLEHQIAGLMLGANTALDNKTVYEVGDDAKDAASLRTAQMVEFEQTAETLSKHRNRAGSQMSERDAVEVARVLDQMHTSMRNLILEGEPPSTELALRATDVFAVLAEVAKGIEPFVPATARADLQALAQKIDQCAGSLQRQVEQRDSRLGDFLRKTG